MSPQKVFLIFAIIILIDKSQSCQTESQQGRMRVASGNKWPFRTSRINLRPLKTESGSEKLFCGTDRLNSRIMDRTQHLEDLKKETRFK